MKAVGGGEFETEADADHTGLLCGMGETEIGTGGELERFEAVGDEGIAQGGGKSGEGVGGGGVSVEGMADAGDADIAQDVVDLLDVHEHAGVGIDGAGDGGAEEEEGAEAFEARVSGKAVATDAWGAGFNAEA